MNQFDVTVIGGGPGGYVAAIRAAQNGLKVALVEKDELGGTCLNWGCIPTKALLRRAEMFHFCKHDAKANGINIKEVSFDLTKQIEGSREVVKKLVTGVNFLVKKNKITLFKGTAKITSATAVSVTGSKTETINSNNIIIATGARPRVLKGLEPDGKLIWTSKEALLPDVMPKKLLVVGTGAIGVEFANYFAHLGSDVTMVEIADRILIAEDSEISAMAEKFFTEKGIDIQKQTTVSELKLGKNNVTATLKSIKTGKTQAAKFDRVIMAVGVVGNTEELGLEQVGVKVEKNQIVTNDYLQTAVPTIYAIGDVAGAPWLAHKASHEGVMAADHIAGKTVKPMVKANIPGCTYTSPQIASIGVTEDQAKEQKLNYKVGRFPFSANGKAIAMGEEQGMVKVLFDNSTGELLGAHMIGAEVTEMIQGFAITKTVEATDQDLQHTIFPHPTLSEMMHEASLDSDDLAIHS